MSYNTGIPSAGDARAQSQAQIKANYQAINNVWSRNHYTLKKNNEFQGMHTVLTIRPQSGDPTTTADQVALYNKLAAGIPALFYRPSNNQTPIQLTYPSISTIASTQKQYSFLAGPFIVHFGFILGTPTNGTVVTLTPGTQLLYAGVTSLQPQNGVPIVNKACFATNLNTPANSFTITLDNSAAIQIVYYLAIGI